jgi:hypothetical protein
VLHALEYLLGVAIPASPGALLADELGALLDIVDRASETDLIRAIGCLGWRVADLVVHLGPAERGLRGAGAARGCARGRGGVPMFFVKLVRVSALAGQAAVAWSGAGRAGW